MATYDDTLRIGDARAHYFAANGFGDGGYGDRWVKLKAGPLPIYFPNTAARVRAVRLHDIHHVLTGYDTTWTGEAEIAAWEIASGCAAHYAAWILNLNSLAIGLMIAPRAVARAFMRGRRSANLYREQVDTALLASTVGAVRRRLRLDSPPLPRMRDWLAFAGWSGASAAASLATGLLTVGPAVALVSLLR